MNFSVSSTDLLRNLQKVDGAIISNPVLPILEDFLFQISGNELTITSTDLETSIITHMEVSADKDGQIAVPARILTDTLKALPEQPINFSVDEETNGIQITSAYGKYTLAGHEPEDFPDIPSAEDADKIDLDASVVQHAISRTLFATSNDELRLAMTGILAQVDFNKATFVSTDAHKLVKYDYTGVTSDVSSSFILPKKSMNMLKGILPSDGSVSFSFNKSNAFFRFDGTQLICRLIDAKYPDYNAVIPSDNPKTMEVVRRDFQNSLKRIAIYANKTTNQIILSISENSLTISAQDLDFSNEATEQLACVYSDEPMTIGFNAKFLIEMLSVMEDENVILNLDTPNRAGILLPNEQAENEHILMLIMPVMLNY